MSKTTISPTCIIFSKIIFKQLDPNIYFSLLFLFFSSSQHHTLCTNITYKKIYENTTTPPSTIHVLQPKKKEKRKEKHKTYKNIYLWTVFHPSKCVETKNRHLSLFTYNNEKHKFEYIYCYYIYSHISCAKHIYMCSLVSLKLKP